MSPVRRSSKLLACVLRQYAGAGTSAPRSARGPGAMCAGIRRGAPVAPQGTASPAMRGATGGGKTSAPQHQTAPKHCFRPLRPARHRHAPNPILGQIGGKNLRRSGSAGVGRKFGICLWQTPQNRPQMIDPAESTDFTVVFMVVFGVFAAGGPSQGRTLRLAVQFCTPPRGESEPQRLEKGARSGSPHVAAALTLA